MSDRKAISKELSPLLKGDSTVSLPTLSGVLVELMGLIKGSTKRIEQLEEKLSNLESKGVEFAGVYQRALRYRKGQMVVHHGSLWACIAGTDDEPGKSSAWQLAAKGVR